VDGFVEREQNSTHILQLNLEKIGEAPAAVATVVRPIGIFLFFSAGLAVYVILLAVRGVCNGAEILLQAYFSAVLLQLTGC
jgi:hypothetical protein